MALHSTLPVYKVCYDLLVELFVFTKHCSREYKYTLGENVKQETINLMVNVYRANSTREKTPHLRAARENLELVRMLVRVLKDLQQINVEKFVLLNEKIESISKQLTAWQRSGGGSDIIQRMVGGISCYGAGARTTYVQ